MEEVLLQQLRQRSSRYAELSDWCELYGSSGPSLVSRVTGANVSVSVEVSGDKEVFVNVGLGVFVKATPSEAARIAEKQSRRLAEEADTFEQDATQRTAIDLAVAKSKDWAKATIRS